MSTSLNGFEALEDRVLLAGSVTASLNTVTGALTITGDDLSNVMVIHDTGGNGAYEIETAANTKLILVVDGVVNDLGVDANSGDLAVAPTSVVINLLDGLLHDAGGRIHGGEVGLPVQKDGKILPCGIYGRWEA